jgi:hypothetical protein
MSPHDQSGESRGGLIGFLTAPSGLVFVGFMVIAGIYLWSEHRAHLFGVLIWLPLLACPLMHLFHGHGGHGGHTGHRQASNEGAGK